MKSLSANPTSYQDASRFYVGAAPRKGPSPAVQPAAPAGRFSWRSRVGKRDLFLMTTQLAIMARAGLDLATALESAARQCRKPVLQDALRQVHTEVSGGVAVSEALRRHVHVFGDTYVASVAAGEASGRLPEVLDQLAQLQRSELRLQSTVRTLLGYPSLLSAVCLIVVSVLVLFVLPNFATIFDDFETPLPVITQILLSLAGEMRSRFWLWTPMAAAALAATVAWARSEHGRRCRDRFVVQFGPVRTVARALLIGRTFRLLATMLESGVPLVDSLRLVGSSVGNSLVRETFAAVQQDVLNGRGMAGSLLAADVVPDAAGEMIAMAERTGSLGTVSRLIGEYLEEEGEMRLRALAGMLEPAIVIVMGAVVALVVLSVMLPMFDLVTLAQNAG